jgi:hypothetical protein
MAREAAGHTTKIRAIQTTAHEFPTCLDGICIIFASSISTVLLQPSQALVDLPSYLPLQHNPLILLVRHDICGVESRTAQRQNFAKIIHRTNHIHRGLCCREQLSATRKTKKHDEKPQRLLALMRP